ncbi:acyloxyacyl hydrolase [Tateyamaria sp. SN3-11]|uniref:acyloxyacyl hydrolase n=1 Tax=Tateyamaria sp. SN3-11 TaxID=3092147 RepID=UPI0039E92546
MDGQLAALFFMISLSDMTRNHCETGCLARSTAQEAISFSYGDVIFQENTIGREAYLRYDLGSVLGPFQPAIGLSATDSDDVWVGIGATHTTRLWNNQSGAGGYAQLHFMPGLHVQGDGPDLGTAIEFRSGVEVGWQSNKGLRFGVSYDHRSNGDLSSVNPGLETLQLRVSIPFR